MILCYIFDAKFGDLERQNKHFALYMLQFKRFRWIMELDEKRNLKTYPKGSNIGAAVAKGLDFNDFETFLEGLVWGCLLKPLKTSIPNQ